MKQSYNVTNTLQSEPNERKAEEMKTNNRVKEKFRGCLLGALIGDCIGTLFECDYSVSHSVLGDLYNSLTNLSEDEKFLQTNGIDIHAGVNTVREILEKKRHSTAGILDENVKIVLPPRLSISLERRRGSFSRPIERYSDDTVMTKSVLVSLMRCSGFDAKDCAKQLSDDYQENANRKFGILTREILIQLKDSYHDPYGPAKKSMGSNGSFENGSATRVAPLTLYYWYADHSTLIDLTAKMSKITHYHRSGVNGAIFQALAIHMAFNTNLPQKCKDNLSASNSRLSLSQLPILTEGIELESTSNVELENSVLDCSEFLDNLLAKVSIIESRGGSFFDNLKTLIQTHTLRETSLPAEQSYTNKIRIIQEFLHRPVPPKRSEVVEKLGNGTKALESVPTALYCFLLATQYEKLPELTINIKNPVLRSIFYAIFLGGNTDTIASMAGAISGAYWGNMGIPNEIIKVCEGYKDILNIHKDPYGCSFS